MTTVKQLKSINYNDVLNKKELKANLADNFGKPLIYIEGIAYGTIHHMSKYGENIGFKGKFLALNHMTGETFESNACFLPKSLTADLQSILERTGEVKLQADIQIMPSDKNTDGFAWIAEQPKTEARINAEEQLRMEFMGNIKTLLPSPDKKTK